MRGVRGAEWMGRCDENKGNLRPAPYFGLDSVDVDGGRIGHSRGCVDAQPLLSTA